LIVTAGGKNIAPANLEGLLIEDPLIEQVVVIGDGRNFLTALIVPDGEALRAELAARGMRTSPASFALDDALVQRIYRECLERRLAVVSRYEQIGNFALLERPFSVDQGELTPTLKLRRATIQTNFAAQIESLYEAGAATAG
jgi:long-chain acyl-CoA synthetase